MTHIGFTGTRGAITEPQKFGLAAALVSFVESGWTTLHEGDCVGADALAATLAHRQGLWVVSHPPINETFRAYAYADEEREVKGYLERDRDIVMESQYMLALPSGPEQRRGSGTWYTIRFARELLRPGLIVWPDGKTEKM